MSTYKFKLTKRYIVSRDDSSLHAPEPESFADSSAEIASQQDVDVSVYLDDVLKHTVTVTDAGGTLEFTADIADGPHTIRIATAKDPIPATDVCVDQLLIDDVVAVATQHNYNAVVSGTTSTLRQMCAYPNSQPHDYVWWGNTIANDSSLNLPGPFYRPTIVADWQSEWIWDFNKTADGNIWFLEQGDITDILFDSTAQHTHYLSQINTSQDDIKAWYNGIDDSTGSSTLDFTGVGTYGIDSGEDLVYLSDSVDETAEDNNSIVVYDVNEHTQFIGAYKWHQVNSVNQITVT